MRASIFIIGFLAAITSAIPTPEVETSCQNVSTSIHGRYPQRPEPETNVFLSLQQYEACNVNAPMGSASACCVSLMTCVPNYENSTMGVSDSIPTTNTNMIINNPSGILSLGKIPCD